MSEEEVNEERFEAYKTFIDSLYANAQVAIDAGNPELNVYGNMAERAMAAFITHSMVKWQNHNPENTNEWIGEMLEKMVDRAWDRVRDVVPAKPEQVPEGAVIN